MSDMVIAPPADQRLYSLHPEEDVTETSPHRHEVVYLETNLRAALPDRFVGANLGVYWIPGALQEPWVGPDVLVSQPTSNRRHRRVYLVWEHGPLQFVAEVASDRTRSEEREKREQRYRVDLQIPECLYIDLDRRVLELWRLPDGQYYRVPEERGRVYSQELNLWFGWDSQDVFVRIWTPDGRMLLTKEEDLAEQQRLAEERDAALAQAQEAEAERAAARAAEAQTRQQLSEVERRTAELAAELEHLRRRSDDSSEPRGEGQPS
jgi:Uma2 family endonuclease